MINTIILTEAVVLSLLKAAGFTGQAALTMLCVARFESAFNPKAVNVNNNESVDIGLYQINDKWWGDHCDIDQLFDPIYNIECAKLIYNKRGFDAWIAYQKNQDRCDNYTFKGKKYVRD